ncbi:MAG: Lrp/AsnC family transcriptional regulator [Rhodobacteraceae bacterium]|nr:Lrp/AsnC family transcriptional regulator [Paracoccaceae bacterium]
MMIKLDQIDRRILEELQRDSGQSQRELADRVGLSQNACWRRLKVMETGGAIRGRTVVLDRNKLGVGLVVIMMIRTRHHSSEWLTKFRKHVSSIPDVVDFYRIGGDYDYLIKVVTKDMSSYDAIYQRLISKVELENVTSYFAMEAIEEQRPIPLTANRTQS